MNVSLKSATQIAEKQPTQLITDLAELLAFVGLTVDDLPEIYSATHFPLRVPRGFAAKMRKGDPEDPLLKQVLPLTIETQHVPGYSVDPLGERDANTHKSLLHKYKSRVLITITGACTIHCRYCFRQHFDYQTNLPTTEDWSAIVDYIANNPAINEVILSGGDPLTVNNRRLFAVIDQLEALPQLTTLRLHSRTAMLSPERLDARLLERLSESRLQCVLVVHTNHPNEIDDETIVVFQQAKRHGITLLNQTVLLRGINDDAETLTLLSQRLFEAGILPYYLHQLDKVAGAAHFAVSESHAVALYWSLMAALPGYLVPKLVSEHATDAHKTPIDCYGHR